MSGQNAKKRNEKYIAEPKRRYCEDWLCERNARYAVMKLLSQWHLAPSSRAYIRSFWTRVVIAVAAAAAHLAVGNTLVVYIFCSQIYTPPALLAHALSSMPTFSHSLTIRTKWAIERFAQYIFSQI